MKQIRLIEYNSMIWFLLRAALVGTGTSVVLTLARQDSLISILIAFILGFIPVIIFNKLKGINPNKNIIILNNELGFFGKILNIIMMISVFAFIFMLFWNLTNFISTEFLYRTPALFVGLCFILPIIYAGTKDFDVVSKISLICFYVVIMFLILIVAGLTKEIDISNLNPLFQISSNNLMKSVLFIICYNVLPIFLLLIIPENKVKKSTIKSSLAFYGLTFLSIINFFFIIISCFSPELADLYDYAEFHIFKRVSLGDFIDKVESFLSIEWILGIIVSIIIGIHYLKKAFTEMYNADKIKRNIFTFIICALLVILTNYLFKNLTEFENFVSSYLMIVIFVGLFICPLITYIFTRKLANKNQ